MGIEEVKAAENAVTALVNGTEARRFLELKSLDEVREFVRISTEDIDVTGSIMLTLDGVDFVFRCDPELKQGFGPEEGDWEAFNFIFQGEPFDSDDVSATRHSSDAINWFFFVTNACERWAEAAYLVEARMQKE